MSTPGIPVAARSGSPAPLPGRRRSWQAPLVAAVAVVLVVLALRFVAEPVRVSSASMEPTFGAGDHLLVRKRLLGGAQAHAGDAVVLRGRGAAGPHELLVKRVAAVGGDRVGIRDGRLVVNGVRVTEAYVVHAEVDGTYFGPVTVPDGSVFVLGDNRGDSLDSRDFGAVPTDRLVGTVLVRLWPPR